MHAEKLVKVNAWVDVGIAPVVEALNSFREIETISSCQGDGHIFFHVRGDDNKLCDFVSWLASELNQEIDACCEFRLSLEWPGSHSAHGALYVATGATGTISNALSHISRRKNRYYDGRPHTDARN